MTLRLLLVRHGLSSFNLERRIQGRNDLSTLTESGKKQAIKTGEALAGLSINAVYSSPLQRAADTTINILSASKHNLKPSFDKDLLEIELGTWSGMTANEVKEKFPDIYQSWETEPEELILTGTDGKEFKPIQDLMHQAKGFLQKLTNNHSPQKEETVLVIAHNAILRCIVLQLLGQPKKGFRKIQLDNASISVFNLKPSLEKPHQIQLECLNSTTHLNHTHQKKANSKRLILVRHGETNWNLEGRFQGQKDIPLNDNGQAQATAAGAFLSNFQIDKAFSSSMTRPKQTAEVILKSHPGVALELQDGLVEIGHGLWEGKLESEIQSKWPTLLKDWQNHPETVEMPQGETIQTVWSRSVNTWGEICAQISAQETALVVAHDAVNKTIICHLLGLTPADIWMIKQGNGAVSIVDISNSPGKPDVVTCLNLTSHLGSVIDCTAAGAL